MSCNQNRGMASVEKPTATTTTTRRSLSVHPSNESLENIDQSHDPEHVNRQKQQPHQQQNMLLNHYRTQMHHHKIVSGALDVMSQDAEILDATNTYSAHHPISVKPRGRPRKFASTAEAKKLSDRLRYERRRQGINRLEFVPYRPTSSVTPQESEKAGLVANNESAVVD
jgi:hypothetical protein